MSIELPKGLETGIRHAFEVKWFGHSDLQVNIRTSRSLSLAEKKKRCVWNSDENVQLWELSVNSKLTDQTGKSTISYRESFRVSDVEASREHQVKGWVVKALGEALSHHIKQLVCKGQEIPRKRGLQDRQQEPQEWINQAKSVYSGGRMLHFRRWFWDHRRAEADGECPGTLNYKPWM